MRIEFELPERIAGFSAERIPAGGMGKIITTEWLTSHNGSLLTSRLEGLECVFSHIPGLPHRSMFDHILVIIQPNLEAVAYVNELRPVIQGRAARDLKRGENVFPNDLSEILS